MNNRCRLTTLVRRTLAQVMAWCVTELERRSDCEELGERACHNYGVARNLVAQAIAETRHAARYAATEAKIIGHDSPLKR